MTDLIVRLVNETLSVSNNATELLEPILTAVTEKAEEAAASATTADGFADAAAASAAEAATVALDQVDQMVASQERAAEIGFTDTRTQANFSLNASEHDFAVDSYRDGLVTTDDITAIEGWTYTRATAGFVQDAAGAMTLIASGVARRTNKGFLIERAATNLLLHSQEFGDAAWADADPSSAAVTANNRTAPDGTVTADTLTSTAAGAPRRQAVTVTASTAYAVSIYIKAGTAAQSRLLYGAGADAADTLVNWAGGVPTLAPSVGTWTLEPVASGFYRACSMLTTAPGVTASQFSVIPDTSAGGGTMVAWAAQIEAGARRTSYVATAAAPATRNADRPFYDVPDFTFPCVLHAEFIAPADDGRVLALWNSTDTDNSALIGTFAGGVTLSVMKDGAEQSSIAPGGSGGSGPGGAIVAGDLVRVALLLETNNVRLCVNGGFIEADLTAAMPVGIDRVYPGGDHPGAYYLNDYLLRLSIIPGPCSDQTLQALASGSVFYGLQLDYGPGQGDGLFETYEFGRAYKQAGGPHDNRLELYLGRDVDYTAELSVRSNGNGRGAAIYARNHDDTDGIQISYDDADHPHLRFSNAGAFLVQDGNTVVSLRDDVEGGFLTLKAKIATDTDAQTGSVVPDKYLIFYDASGAAFRVPAQAD